MSSLTAFMLGYAACALLHHLLITRPARALQRSERELCISMLRAKDMEIADLADKLNRRSPRLGGDDVPF